jgi:hypothetical protein
VMCANSLGGRSVSSRVSCACSDAAACAICIGWRAAAGRVLCHMYVTVVWCKTVMLAYFCSGSCMHIHASMQCSSSSRMCACCVPCACCVQYSILAAM